MFDILTNPKVKKLNIKTDKISVEYNHNILI